MNTNLNAKFFLEDVKIAVHLDGVETYALEVPPFTSAQNIKQPVIEHFHEVERAELWDLFDNPEGTKIHPWGTSAFIEVYCEGVLMQEISSRTKAMDEQRAQFLEDMCGAFASE